MGVKRWLVGLAVAGLMLGLVGVPAMPAVTDGLAHEHLAGSFGVETSLTVAKHMWGSTWSVVHVASNRDPVNALPVATIGNGLVVLTGGKSLNPGGVKPDKIVLLGGVGVVPQAIEDQAKAAGTEVVRSAGVDRNATVVVTAERWMKVNGIPKNVYVTKSTGSGSPDAVAASVLRDSPTLTLTDDASVAALPRVVSELKAGRVTALGGGAVVPDTTLNTAAGGKATARLVRASRYETVFTIAKYGKVQKSGSAVYLASGTGLKDVMVTGTAKDGVIPLSPSNGESVKVKADALGASRPMVIDGTGVMPDTTVQAATTGITPKPKLKDMTLAEMRVNYLLAGEPEHLSSDIASCSYCLNDGDESRIFYDAIGMPMVFKAELYTNIIPQRPLDMRPWMSKDLSDMQHWFIDSNYRNYGDMTDPTVIHGFGMSLAAKPKPNNVGADYSTFYLPQRRKGMGHPEWAKPFPYGKHFEEAGYSCAGDKTGLKCFHWNDGDSTENNPHW